MSGTLLRERNKAVIYVTSGDRLLVFREPDHPQFGIQPPGGTINPGERPAAGAARELFEETGLLVAPSDMSEIGRQDYEYEDGGARHLHHRFYFHTIVDEPVDREWTRREPNPDGADRVIMMALYWTPVSRELELFGGLDFFLPVLRIRLAARGY